MDLSQALTCELCDELAKRAAVDVIPVDPYDPFVLTLNGEKVYENCGPYFIYLVYD